MNFPSGNQVLLTHADQELVVVEVGGGIRSYRRGGADVIDGYAEGEMCTGGRGQILAPWPNRLGDGRYEWSGRSFQLALSEPDHHNAIHGLVRWLNWRMIGRAQNRVSLQCDLRPSPAYPFALRLEVEYRLGREGLSVTTDAQNIGDVDLPFGLGFHPYLTVGTTTVDQSRLRVPAQRRLVTDERGLPTGSVAVAGSEYDFTGGRPVGVTRLDTAFCDLARDGDGRVRIDLDHPDGVAGVTVWADDRFGHVMIYSGDTLPEGERRTALAVEPMTCPPDAFRTGTDVTTLRPGARWTGIWGITPR